ncbi:MAG TPA: LytTR family DNA-binding domain-containing protein [Terriglobales bacterium]|nr:LytTR family DNA-binding domain-containing protein [Terriglobales bacterium]
MAIRALTPVSGSTLSSLSSRPDFNQPPINRESKQSSDSKFERLVFKTRGRVVFVRLEDIQWVSAEGNYLRLHLEKESYLLRATMASMENRVSPDLFMRIHRSTMVNLRFVKEMDMGAALGESVVVLQNGTRLNLSRGYRHRLKNLITRWNSGQPGQSQPSQS